MAAAVTTEPDTVPMEAIASCARSKSCCCVMVPVSIASRTSASAVVPCSEMRRYMTSGSANTSLSRSKSALSRRVYTPSARS